MPSTALLVMDVQVGNISQLSKLSQMDEKVLPKTYIPEVYLPLLSKTITGARSHAIQIIYVTIAFRPGYPEIHPSNLTFSTGTKENKFLVGAADTAIEPSIAPIAGDIVVEKKRVSAFTGSGLDVILRSLGVTKLVLAGIATGGVVLSTLCEAADRDFELVVLEDLCWDRKETHNFLMEKIFQKRTKEIYRAEQWLEKLENEGGK